MSMSHLCTLEHGSNHLATPDCGPTNDDVFLAMVLCQSGFAAETLATAINVALVGPLASMDSTVAGQRAAVAESLLAIRLFAHVRALTRVCPLMDSQGRALDE